MRELVYDLNSLIIALALAALMAGAMELGLRLGRGDGGRTSRASRDQVGTVQASLLGIMALMLGFTFSMALERFNARSAAVVAEANAIGTAALRAELLPEAARSEALGTLRTYTDLRVRAALTALPGPGRQALRAEAVRSQGALWALAVRATRLEPNAATSGLFTQSLNEVIDSFGRTTAEVDRHVPELILLLLYASFLLSGGLIGYSAGLAGHRPARATYAMVGMVVLLLFMVMDLDRPRRGLITVSQGPLLDLQAALGGPPR